MNTETPVMTATPYEPPQMTVVPLRASASMLVGSMVGMESLDSERWLFVNESNNVVSEWSTLDDNSLDDQGWGSSFF